MAQITTTPQENDLVLIFAGQSQFGNSGDVLETTAAAAAVYYNRADGQFYECLDPLPDGSGGGGSLLTRLGHIYSAETTKPWPRLVLAPAIANGTSAGEWLPGETPDLHSTHIVQVYNDLVALGFPPAAIVWGQGSSDVNAGTPLFEYVQTLNAIVSAARNAGIDVPWFVSRSTHCRLGKGPEFENVPRPERLATLKAQRVMQEAQRLVPSHTLGIYEGPAIDLIGSAGRHDDCHLSDWGQTVAAELLLDVLLSANDAGLLEGGDITVPPPSGQQTAFEIVLDSDYADNAVQTIRNVVPASVVVASGTEARFTFEQNSGTGGRTIANASAAEQLSGAGAVVPPTRITFDGGQSSAVLGNSAPLVSDWISFPVDETKPYLVSWDQAPGATMRGRQSLSGHGVYTATGQQAMDQAATGFTLASATTTVGLAKIEVR